jgi:putative ABC transport system substrate-binding protein
VNPVSPLTKTETTDVREGAGTLGLKLLVLNASNEGEIDTAFATLVQERAGALLLSADTFVTYNYDRIVDLAARYAVPTIYASREGAVAGGLLTYADSLADSYRLVGVYTGRILKGDKPADLPVQQSTKIELIINLKTAKALGLFHCSAAPTR